MNSGLVTNKLGPEANRIEMGVRGDEPLRSRHNRVTYHNHYNFVFALDLGRSGL